MSVHNPRFLPSVLTVCVSRLCLPSSSAPASHPPSFPSSDSQLPDLLAWPGCGPGACPCVQRRLEAGERREVVRVLARPRKAGSFPHAHWDLTIYADGHSQACYYWRIAHLASSLPGFQPAPTPQAASASHWCQGPLLDSPGDPAHTGLGLDRFLGSSTRPFHLPHSMVLSSLSLRLGCEGWSTWPDVLRPSWDWLISTSPIRR